MSTALRPAVALAVGLVLAATACGGGSESTTALEASADGAPSDRAFSATTIEGEDLVLADYEGQDVMLWFWAPW